MQETYQNNRGGCRKKKQHLHFPKSWKYQHYFEFQIWSKSKNIFVLLPIMCRKQDLLNFKNAHIKLHESLKAMYP